MGEEVKKLTIFVSGPSDATTEMNRVKDVLESLNKVFCPALGIVLEIAMGSTHGRAGIGRPQTRINPWVEKCDLLVGVYKKRFGSPTGNYESGSEEEFQIAFTRNQTNNGIPEIIMFFQDLAENELEDIGPQLERLVEFKDDIREHVFYNTFHDDSDLIIQSYEQIMQWIYEVTKGVHKVVFTSSEEVEI